LYPYFPSKEALVTAVIDRHTRQVSEMTRRALGGAPIEVAAREFVGVAIEAHRIDPRLHGVLAERIPCVERLENIQANVREGYALVGLSRGTSSEIDVADLDLGAFVLVTVVEALTHAESCVARTFSETRKHNGCGRCNAPRYPGIGERRTGKQEEAQYSEERAVRLIPPPVSHVRPA
jgi:AcrR family transcriptional regulator